MYKIHLVVKDMGGKGSGPKVGDRIKFHDAYHVEHRKRCRAWRERLKAQNHPDHEVLQVDA